jgi:hypothetical protein
MENDDRIGSNPAAGGSVMSEPDSAAARSPGKAEGKVQAGMRAAANRIEDAAHRLDSFADERTEGASGRMAQAGDVAHDVANTMESVAQYLRDSDIRGLKSDLEGQIREKPLQMLLIGVASGWLAGKLLR